MKKLLAFLLVLIMLGGVAYANTGDVPDLPDGPIPTAPPAEIPD